MREMFGRMCGIGRNGLSAESRDATCNDYTLTCDSTVCDESKLPDGSCICTTK